MSVLVSISCITYNHEKYIAQAIESFLMQQTDFNYEILIHDDASTDRTADIIREYESKYPNIIKPIYQNENQYSMGVKISATFNWPRAQGKYIALCEGDDYWTDPLKLQKQVDYMDKHPECSMCIHAVQVGGENGILTGRIIKPNIKTNVVKASDFLLAGGRNFHTSSIVFQRKLITNLPKWYYEAPIEDYPLALICSHYGEVYYIDEILSTYRFLILGSWTMRLSNSSIEELAQYQLAKIKMLKDFDDFSNKVFHNILNNQILELQRDYLMLQVNSSCLNLE